jgi:hypothetical protein
MVPKKKVRIAEETTPSSHQFTRRHKDAILAAGESINQLASMLRGDYN